MLVKEKWTFDSGNRKGRPPIDRETEELIIRLLKENPSWGSDRVVGALKNLGIKVSDTTIDNIRKRNGIPPAPEREKKVNWSRFLRAHWEGLIAADFFTTEVLCRSGLVTYYTLFVIELKTRLVHICGSTLNPDEEWMLQIARNLTDFEAGFAVGKSHLIIDRDTKYTDKFKTMLDDFGNEIVLCPPRPKISVLSIPEPRLLRLGLFLPAISRRTGLQFGLWPPIEQIKPVDSDFSRKVSFISRSKTQSFRATLWDASVDASSHTCYEGLSFLKCCQAAKKSGSQLL